MGKKVPNNLLKYCLPFVAAILSIVLMLGEIHALDDSFIAVNALNQKNAESSGTEVWIKDVTIEGSVYTAKNVFVGASWIDEDGYLKWRTYDVPADLGNTVTFELPKGSFDISFDQSKWRGQVAIKVGKPYYFVVDCYSPNDAARTAEIWYSEAKHLSNLRIEPTFLLGVFVLILSILDFFAVAFQKPQLTPTNTKPRELWLDVLKVMSAPLIVLIHTVGSAYSTTELGSSKWIGFLFLNVLPRCAVPLFIMISGILLIGHEPAPEKVRQNVKKALVLLFVWNAFFILLRSVVYGSSEGLLKQFLSIPIKRGPSGHLWYSYLLVWIYLFAPILNKLYYALSARQRRYFVVLTVAIPGVLDLYNRVFRLNGPVNLPAFLTYMSLTYMGMMFLGRMVYESTCDRKILTKYGTISLFGGFFATILISYFYSVRHGTATDQFTPETQFFVMFYSVGILMLAAAHRDSFERISDTAKKAVSFLSQRSLGIYFAHVTAIWLISAVPIGSTVHMVRDGAVTAVLFCILYYILTVIAVYFMSNIPGLCRLVK